MQEIVNCYIDMLQAALPFVLVFGFGNMAISTLVRAMFGGRLYIK